VKFYVTFGQRYAQEPHPHIDGVHPDGVLELEAKDWEDARERVFSLTNAAHSFIYDESDMQHFWGHFPMGVTHSADDDLVVRKIDKEQ